MTKKPAKRKGSKTEREMWNLSEVRQSRGSVPFTRATRLESISIERVNWRSMSTVTWHRSFLSISSEFRGNAVEPRYIFERRMLEKLGSRHEVDVEMRRVSVIQITFHWHASLRLRSLLSFRLLSTRERKARAIFLFPSSFSFLFPSSSHPFCSCFSSFLISITFLS